MNQTTNLNDGELLRRLAKDRQTSEREKLTICELLEANKSTIDALIPTIENEILRLMIEARKQCDSFWCANKAARDEKLQWRMGTRVRFYKGSLLLEWYKNRFVPGEDPSKKEVLSTFIPKGAGNSFNIEGLKKLCLSDWEREVVEETEKEYATIRARYNHLSKMKRYLMMYKKLTDIELAR